MIAIIDSRTPDDIRSSLSSFGYELLLMPESSRLAKPVAAHPDMRIFILGKKVFLSGEEKEALSFITDKLKKSGYEIVYSSVSLSEKYPHNIAFNCFTVGKFLFGKLQALAPEISEEAKAQGHTPVSVHQGYSKCSTLIVDENSIITADPSIYTAATSVGIDALFINNPENAIMLHGYSCGFIGGASGATADTIYFCGNIDLHPDKDNIRAFCEKHQKAVVSLGDQRLLDIGSILFV